MGDLVTQITGQAWGNVANMPASTYYSGTAAVAAGSGSTYGAVGGAGFDFRVVRYFPAQVAVSVWNAGNSLLTAYNAAVTSYTAAKTTWDAYVAILEKNAKMDAFAAAFSPPKAPTVPPLPNLPWVPAAYSGYVKQTPAENATMLANSGSANTMLSAAQPTAQLLSAVWRRQWTCGAASTASTTGSPCVGAYTVTSSSLPTALTAATPVDNTTRLMVVVSLWSLGE